MNYQLPSLPTNPKPTINYIVVWYRRLTTDFCTCTTYKQLIYFFYACTNDFRRFSLQCANAPSEKTEHYPNFHVMSLRIPTGKVHTKVFSEMPTRFLANFHYSGCSIIISAHIRTWATTTKTRTVPPTKQELPLRTSFSGKRFFTPTGWQRLQQ